MPFYDVHHCVSLTKEERDRLAEAITFIHTRTFAVPRLFVNVQFTDLRNYHTYVAGKEQNTNRVLAYVRPGASRTREHFVNVSKQIKQAWEEIVNGGAIGHGDRELRLIAVMDNIVAGLEAGFVVPVAGEEAAWFKNHKPEFEKLAADGDAEFANLLEEIETRDDQRKQM